MSFWSVSFVGAVSYILLDPITVREHLSFQVGVHKY
jgi:hypothetical protein